MTGSGPRGSSCAVVVIAGDAVPGSRAWRASRDVSRHRRWLVQHAVMVVLALVVPVRAALAAVEIEVQLARGAVSVGEGNSLLVTVRGASGAVSSPEFELPSGLDAAASGRSQSFSWINGRSSSEITFRYELAPRRAGNFAIGPIRVQVGNEVFAHPAVTFRAEAGGAGGPGSGGGGAQRVMEDANDGPAPASLIVDVTPREPYVGEAVVMRVRLVQRSPLAEDPRYSPPPTPGFWGETASVPESYYGSQSGVRVLVTETRTRLYPLVPGIQTVGAAEAILVVETGGQAFDPFGWFRGGARRQMEIRSNPVRVRVRALPAGAPANFGGAVGAYTLQWSVDRPRTSQDQPLTVRLDVRGSGNLPLLRTPEFRPEGFEVFASTLEDSFAASGTIEGGRRAFRWTVLPRSLGQLALDPPAFNWFDPATGAYRTAQLEPLTIEVGPAVSTSADRAAPFPGAFATVPLDPFARPSQPWWLALSGLLLGVALALVRAARRPAEGKSEHAERARWLAAVAGASGDGLWTEAERARVWLAARGVDVAALGADISAARYGGARVDPESVRARVIEALRHATPRAGSRWILPTAAAAAIAAAALCAFIGAPRAGADAGRARAASAERAARSGNIAGAERVWRALWKDGARAPGLAARLAWCRLEFDDVAPAALWVLRGEREDGRDVALGWVKARVREAGGLTGSPGRAVPLTRLEWGVLGALFGLAAGIAWPRRRASAACTALFIGCALAMPAQSLAIAGRGEAVVMRDARLGGTDIDLEPGRVVRLRGSTGARQTVTAGSGVSGWLPSDALRTVDSLQ